MKDAPTIHITAEERFTPKSIKLRTANSNIEIRDEKPAKLKPRKNRIARGLPNAILANN